MENPQAWRTRTAWRRNCRDSSRMAGFRWIALVRRNARRVPRQRAIRIDVHRHHRLAARENSLCIGISRTDRGEFAQRRAYRAPVPSWRVGSAGWIGSASRRRHSRHPRGVGPLIKRYMPATRRSWSATASASRWRSRMTSARLAGGTLDQRRAAVRTLYRGKAGWIA